MDSRENNPQGLRHRFITPAAPAPVPEKTAPSHKKKDQEVSLDRESLKERVRADVNRKAAHTPTHDHAEPKKEDSAVAVAERSDDKSSDADVVSSTGSMAIATLLSRITGFLRIVVIGATLGDVISSAFDAANTLPNLITEIVLGAVLSSLVVPVLVRAEKEDPDRGERFIRQLFTVATTLLIVITVLAVICAPLLTRTILKEDGEVNVTQSTSFAYLLLPQIFFYGIFALLMAVLNTRSVFKPGAWAPVANNVIVLLVLFLYRFVPGSLSPSEDAGVTNPHVLLLGIGTTLGVVVQMLILLPYVRKLGISLKPLWGIDTRLKQFAGMGVAIIVYVAISQFGYIITTRIASGADSAAVNIYQKAWLLLQMPYGIIGVTLLTAIMPRLSRNAANGDDKAVIGDLGLGSRLTFLALIPIVVFLTAFGTPIAVGLFNYGEYSLHASHILGLTISFSAFTLLPYALVLLHLRVFYAREEAWTPTFIIGGITVTKVLLSSLAPILADSPEDVVVLLGAANGFGFLAGAGIGGFLLRRKLSNLGMRSVAHTSMWALGASLVGVAIAIVINWLLNRFAAPIFAPLGSIGHLLQLIIVGAIFLIVTALVLSKSKLEEVLTIGRALTRIPGMSRFITVPPQDLSDDEIAENTDAALAEALAFDDVFNATPVPPPMSAGVVRGPRLVPGAEVSDGRFRLLADHGSVPGARFWQAREKATGRDVALTFVDTTGQAPVAPASPAKAAGLAAEVTRRTKALGKLHAAAVAPGIEVLSYPTGALVVADWVPGRSLSAVAATHPDPYAAALAFGPLADAAVDAHDAHTLLGLDNRARLRISTDGIATLAFPAVLPDATKEHDFQAIRSGLAQLIDEKKAPEAVTSLLTVNPEHLPETLTDLERSLLGTEDLPEESPLEDTDTHFLQITEDGTPAPRVKPGFGRAGYSRGVVGGVAAAATLIVIVVALLIAYLVSVLGNGNDSTPVVTKNIGTSTSAAPSPDYVKALRSAEIVPDITADETTIINDAPELIDDDADTSWIIEPGAGIVINLQYPSVLSSLIINTATQEPVDIKIYELPVEPSESNATTTVKSFKDMNSEDTNSEIPDLSTYTLLTENTLTQTETKIPLSESREISSLIIVIDPANPQVDNDIERIQIIGKGSAE